MSQTDYSNLETSLSELLRQEADLAARMTDTWAELERFRGRKPYRPRDWRVLTAIAAVLIVLAGAVAIILTQTGASRKPQPAKSPKVKSYFFGPPQSVPANLTAHTLRGPQVLGVAAFGAIWATGGNTGRATLYRVSLDGRRILSRTPYPGVNGNLLAPIRVGLSIVVADGEDFRYTVFDRTGRRIGSLPGVRDGVATGDPGGGWVVTHDGTISRVGPTGLRVVRTVHVTDPAEIVGVASSPGHLWVIDSDHRLLRVDAATGAITGQTSFTTKLTANASVAVQPTTVVYRLGAVDVVTQAFGFERVDPRTMQVTSSVYVHPNLAWPSLATSSSGQLWAEPSSGTIAQIHPQTMRPMRRVRVFSSASKSFPAGAVIAGSRLYITDYNRHLLYTLPLP